MDEIEKIRYAKSFIDQLAQGVNPVDGIPVAEKDVINNVRITRCLFFVSDVLGKVCNGEYSKPQPKPKKSSFFVDDELISKLKVENRKMSASEIAARIDEVNENDGSTYKFPRRAIGEWMIENGFLTEDVDNGGKRKKSPTLKGESMGVIGESRVGYKGDAYTAILFNADAQRLIYDNLKSIVIDHYDRINNKKADFSEGMPENAGLPWSAADEERLKEMYSDGLTAEAIAADLKRNVSGVKARMKKLGLL